MELQYLLISLVIYGLVSCDSPYRPKTIDGDFCVIPFQNNGNTYHDCTSDGDSQPWCKNSANQVAYCEPKPDWGSCNVAPPSVSLDDVNLILSLVNNLRAGEPAIRMTRLRWNSELAQRAQYFSNQCEISGDVNNLCSSNKPMGQLSYQFSSSQPLPKKWKEFFDAFYNMKSYYDFSSNTCSDPNCVAYKQLVNAKTAYIGCGVASCNKNNLYTDVYFCTFYLPVYSDPPYEQGSPPCTDCYNLGMDDFYQCNANLCDICDHPGPNCKSLKTEMAAGRVCIDLQPSFCATYINYCGIIANLEASSKALLTTNCQKTCKLCK